IEQTIRLRENESSVLSGIIQSSDIRSISGLPWTSTTPIARDLIGQNADTGQKTETFIVITPRALRLPAHNVPALYAGPGEPATPPAGPQGPNPQPGQPGPPGAPPPGTQPPPA